MVVYTMEKYGTRIVREDEDVGAVEGCESV
jgi:hypothetical protein